MIIMRHWTFCNIKLDLLKTKMVFARDVSESVHNQIAKFNFILVRESAVDLIEDGNPIK